jgi:hypothetical protein
MRALRSIPPAVALALAVWMLVPAARAETWEIYRPAGAHQSVGAGFRVNMPAEFEQLEPMPGGAIGVEAERGGMKFTTSHRPHPVRPERIDADLDAVRDELIRQAGDVKLRTAKRLIVSGFPALELMLEKAGGPVVALRRFLIVNGWLIVLAVDGPSGLETKTEPQWFLESLTLVGPQHGEAPAMPVREYVVCFNGNPCGGMPCPSISALDVAAAQELQGVYFDLDSLPAAARAQVNEEDMFKGRVVVAGRMMQGQMAESREYPLLRVSAIVRKATAAERKHCSVRD